MKTLTAQAEDVSAKKSLAWFADLLADVHPRDFSIRLWDGSTLDPEPNQPSRFTLVLSHPGVLRKLFWQSSSQKLGEAYIHNEIDIEGDLESAMVLREYLTDTKYPALEKIRFARFLLSLPGLPAASSNNHTARLCGAPASRDRTREAISHHYDLPADFFRLWVGDDLIYTCAYFGSVSVDLEGAQRRKLDMICKKLALQPGERFLDIGCGWGGLVVHAARHYGVKAMGITLSRSQADHANAAFREMGLSDQCQVECCDFRDAGDLGRFDKVASVGAIEHFSDMLTDYFRQAWRLLLPGGRFLIQGVASNPSHPVPPGPSFIDSFIFPDSYLVPLHVTLRYAEETGFDVRDVENLREHYTRTLRLWAQNLEQRRQEILQIADEVTYRAFRLYLNGFAHFFHAGHFNLYQTLLAKPDPGRNLSPTTREGWYRESGMLCRAG